jgi:hypothetical protein
VLAIGAVSLHGVILIAAMSSAGFLGGLIMPSRDILRARIFAIACGYEDADDLDWLRSDPAFTLAGFGKAAYTLVGGRDFVVVSFFEGGDRWIRNELAAGNS